MTPQYLAFALFLAIFALGVYWSIKSPDRRPVLLLLCAYGFLGAMYYIAILFFDVLGHSMSSILRSMQAAIVLGLTIYTATQPRGKNE